MTGPVCLSLGCMDILEKLIITHLAKAAPRLVRPRHIFSIISPNNRVETLLLDPENVGVDGI